MFYENGVKTWYHLRDHAFVGLSYKMERLIQNEWRHFTEKHSYPPTVKWFLACCASYYVMDERNPEIYGGTYKEPSITAYLKEMLVESWGFNNAADFKRMLPLLLDGRAVNSYNSTLENIDELDLDGQRLVNKIQQTCGKNGIWAWDLQRLILISGMGYICNYISYEDSLYWCLRAGQKLQEKYKSWDEFMNAYLLGYCFWCGDDIDDETSSAYERMKIYRFYKDSDKSPLDINWNYAIRREW